MGTRMNAAFIFNLVHAIKTDTWADTDARYFFPTVVLVTLAGEWACLLGWWARLARAALGPVLAAAASHQRRLTPSLRRGLNRLRKALDPGQHDDHHHHHPNAAAAASGGGDPPAALPPLLRGRRLALAFLCFWGFKHRFPFFPKRASYSPVANAFHATVRYAARDEFRRDRQPSPPPQQQQSESKAYYERVPLPALGATRKTNVVFVLNDSLGNRILQSEQGLDAYPFYRDRIQGGEDPAFFDFSNNRACSGNTNSAAPAALTGGLAG